MIPFETCVAIRDLVKLLVEVRQYWQSSTFDLKFGDDKLDLKFGNHAIVFDYQHEIYLNRLSPSQSEVINIRPNGTVHSMYAAMHSDGWHIQMGDYLGSTYDTFGYYNIETNTLEPQDLLILDTPRTVDDYECALFQLSTIHDPQIASLLLVNIFVRDIIAGSDSKICTRAVLYQLHENEIRTMTKLLEHQYTELRNLERV